MKVNLWPLRPWLTVIFFLLLSIFLFVCPVFQDFICISYLLCWGPFSRCFGALDHVIQSFLAGSYLLWKLRLFLWLTDEFFVLENLKNIPRWRLQSACFVWKKTKQKKNITEDISYNKGEPYNWDEVWSGAYFPRHKIIYKNQAKHCSSHMELYSSSSLRSAVVRQKGGGRGVWRSDAEVAHAQRPDGCCEWLFFLITWQKNRVWKHNLFSAEHLFQTAVICPS